MEVLPHEVHDSRTDARLRFQGMMGAFGSTSNSVGSDISVRIYDKCRGWDDESDAHEYVGSIIYYVDGELSGRIFHVGKTLDELVEWYLANDQAHFAVAGTSTIRDALKRAARHGMDGEGRFEVRTYLRDLYYKMKTAL